ncbi:MAG TPA: IgGFc-binding protein, partial [Flavitalea sp.]|nr:IgGFc-binding protein [Flavitalea sp.]
MRTFLPAFLIFFSGYTAISQDFTNKGKDFWIGYGNHIRMFNSGVAERMELYFTSDVNTTGQVTIAGIGFSQPFSVVANQITTMSIPRSAALMQEGIYNLGIHVTSQKAIVVYSFIYVNAISGATLCLPTSTLGREYYSVNYTQESNEPNSFSYFFAVATDTGTTTLEILPTQTSIQGRPAGVPFFLNLSQGQVFQYLSQIDLTGSSIRSINSGAGCKKISVFSGSGKISIGCLNPGTSDNLYQQMYPTSTWGKTYITVPSINSGLTSQNNYLRIFKSNPTAIVKVNGGIILPGSFINGQYCDLPMSNTPNLVESDLPVMVAQYFSTQGCSGNSGVGDPEMIFLNPVEQTVNNVTLNSMQPIVNTAITEHFINVVIKNSPTALNTFKIDGNAYGVSFLSHPYIPGYAYAQIPVSRGTHTISCDTPFNAIAYGFGIAESYGYSAGTNLKDLYQFISIHNDYSTVNFPAGCKNSPFRFSMTFPYQPTNIQWKFGTALNGMGLI